MACFITVNEESIASGQFAENPKLFLDLFRCYANTYASGHAVNIFIKGFGANFETFEPQQMVHFCESLGVTGHQQEDVFVAVLDNLKTQMGVQENADMFKKTHGPLLHTLLKIRMKDNESFKKCLDHI